MENQQNETTTKENINADISKLQVVNNDKEEDTIDLGAIFNLLLARIGWIILMGVLVGIVAFVITKFVIVPKYTTSTQILVINENKNAADSAGNGVNFSNIQSSTYLAKDYVYMITSKPVMQQVISELGLQDISYSDLASQISVTTPDDTRILIISVTDEDPVKAKQIADSVRENSIEHIQSVIGTDTVRSIDGDIGAVIPTSQSSPNVKRDTILGVLLGIIIACAIIILRYILDDSIKTEEDVHNRIGLSVLVNMPFKNDIEKSLYEDDEEKNSKNKLKLRQNGQVISTNKNVRLDTTISEAYKKLRSNVQFSGRHNRVIGITSTIPNEGKSIIAMNLAFSLSELGKRVIFIDADLRHSVLIGRYKVGRQVKGLTHYLSGVNSFDEIVCETNVKNLHMVFSGTVPPNPSELLESVYFRELVKQLRQAYDYVIIDTPPIGAVIDAAIVGKECDGVLLVIGSGDISYKGVQRTESQLRASGSKIIGVALNKVPMGKAGRGYGKYGYGGYGGYGNYGNYGEYGNYGSVGKYVENPEKIDKKKKIRK
jgi:capsular exopolysaccharide synthesis family protein